MDVTSAKILVAVVGVYTALGLLFSVVFVTRGVRRIDPGARAGATWGFRVLIIPGAVALWPFLGWRWARGIDAPPGERTAHRDAAGPERAS